MRLIRSEFIRLIYTENLFFSLEDFVQKTFNFNRNSMHNLSAKFLCLTLNDLKHYTNKFRKAILFEFFLLQTIFLSIKLSYYSKDTPELISSQKSKMKRIEISDAASCIYQLDFVLEEWGL